jgi:hypothetical protein
MLFAAQDGEKIKGTLIYLPLKKSDLTRMSPITTSDNRGMRFAVLVLSFSGALSQCASYSTNVQSACDLTNPPTEDTAATRFCNGACNTALNTASNGCSASVTDEAESKQAADSMLAYCSGPPSCTQAYTSMQAECDLANPPSPGNEATRFCNGACNAAVNTTSNVCSASVTEEAQGKQNADQMLSHCSPPSSPPSVTETSGSGLTKVQVDVTSDKGAGTPSAEYFIGICAFATSGSAPVFCH